MFLSPFVSKAKINDTKAVPSAFLHLLLKLKINMIQRPSHPPFVSKAKDQYDTKAVPSSFCF